MDHRNASQVPYGHCSTFFTELDDGHGVYAQRLEARKRTQAQARQTQKVLAVELSNVTSDEYQDDILSCMETMEVSGSFFRHVKHS